MTLTADFWEQVKPAIVKLRYGDCLEWNAVADKIGIHVETLRKWRKRSPEFANELCLPNPHTWPEAKRRRAIEMWRTSPLGCDTIARQLKITKNALCGAMNRAGLSPRHMHRIGGQT